MKILSVASAIPQTIVANLELERVIGLEPGWIESRTGIRQRPIAAGDEATSDLAVRAGSRALQEAGIAAGDIGLLLLATSTPDHLLPPTAPLVAHRLGLPNAGAVDIAGACSGFLYALILGYAHGQNLKKPVLIIGANVLTRRIQPLDAATASLFSDGAGAVVIAPFEPGCLLGSSLGSDGSQYDAIGIPAGGSREPMTVAAVEANRHLMVMKDGSSLFKNAVRAMADAGKDAMKAANLNATAIDWWIPHQANLRVIRDSGKLLGIPPERTIIVADKYGNSSAATIPIALADAVESGRIGRGQVLLMTAAGAGMIRAGAVIRW